MLVIVMLPTTAFFILRNSKIQTHLTQKIVKEVSKNINAKIEVGAVRVRFFNRIVLKNVYIEDQLQDTLLFSKNIICNIKKFDRKKRIINISTINLLETKFYLNKYDTIYPINLVSLLENAKKDSVEQNKDKWQINFKNIEMHQTVFWYKSIRKSNKRDGIHFNNLICYIEDIETRDFTIKNGAVDFNLRKLKFKEQSGFRVYNMKSNISISKEHMIYRNLTIRTPQSYIRSDSICFYQKDYYDYFKFAKNVRLSLSFQESNVSFNDIGYFATSLKNINLNIGISGRFYSKLSTFKGKNVKLHIGDQTELITDFNINGLPDYKQMFIYVDFKKLTTWAKDFELINKFIKSGKEISIPDNFDKLGIISYKGNFAGFYDDFVTYGKFTSDLGNVSTDLSLQPDTSQILNLNGSFKTKDFQIGKLSEYDNIIGKLSMSAKINGAVGKKTIKAKTDGIVKSIEINNYNYQNIKFDGYLTEKTYNGIFSITDPNIQMNFSGGIDFSKEIPVFNFYANVPKAKLFELNIDKKDTTSFLSFDLEANFKGIDIDNAIGTIKFHNASLIKFNDEMSFNQLDIISEYVSDTHRIELQSDYIDAKLVGIYKSSSAIQSLRNLYYNYLPGLIKNPNDTCNVNYKNNFTLDLSLKKTNLISKFFIPTLLVSDSSKFNFNYNADSNKFLLNSSFKKLKYKNHIFNNLQVNTYSNDSLFTTITKCASLLLNNYFTLDNFKTTSTAKNNNIDLMIDWDNHNAISYKGKISLSTSINQKTPFSDPLFKITVLPSQIIVKDSLWNINKSIIAIDSSSYTVSNLMVSHKNQHLEVKGKISENPNDTLFINIEKLDLANANVLTLKSKLEFDGIINGKANFSNIYDAPLFYSDIEINNLKLNKEEFGLAKINSFWVEKDKSIMLSASTSYNNNETIEIQGNYYPENKNIDCDINIEHIKTRVLTPYMQSFASNISGVTDGKIKMSGTLTKPVFNGELSSQNSTMTIIYTKTPYFFNTNVKLINNSFIFTNTEVVDTYGNIGLTNGIIKFGPRREFNIDFKINADKIHALNTTGLDNDAFYGTAFMTGIVTIKANRENAYMDILGITEKNTKINIPLSHLQSAEESKFIRFTDKQTKPINQTEELANNTTKFQLNFDLEITHDADAQLIFDSKIGDVIRGKGSGNIKMGIDAKNDFKMFGEYVIEEGDYLFTLQNVINKKFKIKRGGNILWNGEPYDATINVEASYNLKTSLSGLVDSSYYNTTDYYKKRIPVECQVLLTEKLMNPNINFNITLPTADEETKTLVRSLINTEEKQNKQFLSLLVLNSFMPEQSSDNYLASTSSPANIGTVTASELLSNQLSRWLSQISDEWDIGVNYRPGDEISKDQVEVALSTQLLNDRVSINGNVGYGGQTADQANNIVGDFNLDVKLNKSGKLRFKAFNESNDKLIYENAPYTQGVGIFYREEFNSFSNLLNKFWRKFRKNEKVQKKD